MEREVSLQFFENAQMSNFVKTSSVGVEISYVDGLTDKHRQPDGQTDMTKTIHDFRNFAKASGKITSFFATKTLIRDFICETQVMRFFF